MKTIVLLSGFRVFPANTGGQVRTSGIAKTLARMGHTVLIYSLAGRIDDYRFADRSRQTHRIDPIEPNLTEETNLGLGFGLMQAIGNRLRYPRYWQHELLRRGMVPKRLRRALEQTDIIMSDMPWCAPVPGAWSGKPWFMISHNLEHRLLEQAGRRQRRFAGWMRKVETQAPRQFRDILVCTAEDQEFFRQHDLSSSLKLPMVGCGVDPTAYDVPPGTRENMRRELGLSDDDRLVIFSASRFPPNVEALAMLREFCRAEAEFLARERIYILVLGSVTETPEREGALIVTGRVPKVTPYFAAGDAGLNAVTSGSGANVKLFEYLAARLPVISTRFGIRGTALVPEVDYLAYEPHQLRAALERFKQRYTRAQWRDHAEAVWARHSRSCDIQAQVTDAVAQLPDFHSASVS
jgi:glycosyltransferase involved in cell wall biosynthesis